MVTSFTNLILEAMKMMLILPVGWDKIKRLKVAFKGALSINAVKCNYRNFVLSLKLLLCIWLIFFLWCPLKKKIVVPKTEIKHIDQIIHILLKFVMATGCWTYWETELKITWPCSSALCEAAAGDHYCCLFNETSTGPKELFITLQIISVI